MKHTVCIIMGSQSDSPVVDKVSETLKELGIYHSLSIYSAHRTPVQLDEHIETYVNSNDECDVVICAAGMSAALAGHVASKTIKPVIGLPLSSKLLQGMDALFSTIRMPPGIPVLTVDIDAAKNAALAAASIIALKDPDIATALKEFREKQTAKVLDANLALHAIASEPGI